MACDPRSNIVARASSGRALKGINFPFSREDEQYKLELSEHFLIDPPSDLAILGTNQAAKYTKFCFSGMQQSQSFCKDVKEKGWTAAMSIHANYMICNGSASVSGGSNNNTTNIISSDTKMSEACIIECAYVPMASFKIPADAKAVKLSQYALRRAGGIKSDADADKFLKEFHPFVSSFEYHLGGAFLRQVLVKMKEQTCVSQIMELIESQKSGSVKMGAQFANFGGSGEFSGSSKELNDHQSSNHDSFNIQQIQEELVVCGATSAKTAGELIDILKSDELSWAIIDCSFARDNTLLSVWDLVLEHSNAASSEEDSINLKKAANLLCQRWVISNTCSEDSDDLNLRNLIKDAKKFLASLSRMPSPASPSIELPSSPDHQVDFSIEGFLEYLKQLSTSTKPNMEEMRKRIKDFISYHERREAGKECIEASGILLVLCESCDSGSLADSLQEVIVYLEKLMRSPDGAASDGASTLKEGLFWLPQDQQPAINVSSLPGSDDSFCFHYAGDLIADRNFSDVTHPKDSQANYSQQLQFAARRYIDCLRHRVNPVQHLLPIACIEKTRRSVISISTSSSQSSSDHAQFSPLELLIYIFQHSDLPTRIEICRLLLLQRASTLLVFPLNLSNPQNQVNHEHYAKQLWHCIDALGFVNVPIENEGSVCIAEDISLPRLVFISDKDVKKSNSAKLATRILQSELVSRYNHRGMGQYMYKMLLPDPVIEVAIGFVPGAKSEHATCIALHVTGPYESLLEFIAVTADFVILELELDQSKIPPCHRLKNMEKNPQIIQWKETAADVDEGYDAENNVIMGQESFLVDQIGLWIAELVSDSTKTISKVRSSLHDDCAKWFYPRKVINFNENVEDVLDDSVLVNMRKSLKLQKSLETEAQAFFESMKVKDNPQKKYVKDWKCSKEKKQRVLMVKDVKDMPILQRFHHLLSQTKAETRIIQIMSLERALGRKMQRILANVSKKVDETYKVYNSNRNNKTTKKKSWEAYTAAKQEYVDKSVGLENLWRELSLIFEVDPDGQNHLAQLAAQYLIDGFPLEIYDGDAGIYRKTWVNRVLTELDKFTTKKDGTPARFFVLSVMGLQSSGKSTMLNLMFGTRLQTSAGRCTRGVYMQLVPSDREEYDYVILIDTEGLRSNDFEGLNEAEARDNRLATFGLLPADASILMVTNEDDRGLKEVLPMVLLAFSNSSVAEKSGGRMKTKMFFVYRSVDTNDKSKLKMSKQKLHDYLRDAAEEVSKMSANKDEMEDVVEANSLLEMVFSDLRVFEDESKSDVRCMGNLKRGGMPPGDTPEWSYGKAVINLREHIHQRVVSDGRRWEATNLADWSDHLALVWKCICTADFELNFRNCVEYNAYMQLQKALQDPRSRVNKRYCDVFLELEREIREMKIPSDDSDSPNISTTFLSRLDTKVSEVVHKETQLVEKILEETKWKKWHAEKLHEWEGSCRATNRFFHRKVEDLVSGILKFDKILADSERSFKTEIVKLIDSGDWKNRYRTKEQRIRLFNEMFCKKLLELQNKHPRIANEVSQRVTKQYSLIGIAKQLDLNKTSNFDKVSQRVTKQYSEIGIAKELDLNKSSLINKAWHFIIDTPNAIRDRILRGSKLKQKEKLLLDNLNKIIDKHLDTAKQYSDVVVSQLVRETREAIDKVNMTREEQENFHFFVKGKLIQRMEAIQNEWDEKHNVAAKFRTKKHDLLCFFLDKAQGLEATDILINDLQRTLKFELGDAFQCALIKKVASKIETKDWLRHPVTLRKFLDYHLLILLDMEKIDRALAYVYNESNHFKTVVDAFIRCAITRDNVAIKEWKALVRKVNNCIPEAPDPTIQNFLGDLKSSLNEVDTKLADNVISSMDCGDTDLKLDMEIYKKKVKELRQCLDDIKQPIIGNMMWELVEGVKDHLEKATDGNGCKTRCEASCPMCGSACMDKKGHDYDSATSRHDCVHQPQGLHGVTHFYTKELFETNCVEAVERKSSIMFDDGARQVPYEKFDEEFPQWRKPESHTYDSSIHVRQYMFFKYQKELCKFFTNKTIKPCPPNRMPPGYNHDIKAIKSDLKNKLERTTSNLKEIEDMFKRLD